MTGSRMRNTYRAQSDGGAGADYAAERLADEQLTPEEERAEAWHYWQERACKAEAETARLRAALEEIAADEKVYKGHGDYDEGPLPNDYCQRLARRALTP